MQNVIAYTRDGMHGTKLPMYSEYHLIICIKKDYVCRSTMISPN